MPSVNQATARVTQFSCTQVNLEDEEALTKLVGNLDYIQWQT